MSKAPESAYAAGTVVFELDRFELVGGNVWELQGRWFGVRGRRFMRPALTVIVGGRPARLLADLEHKPWVAQDGEMWKAAFPRPAEGEEFDEAELTVAPDITIALPTAHGGRNARRKKATGELALARDQQRRLERRLDRLEAEKIKAAARIDQLIGDLDQVTHQRDEARAAGDLTATRCEALERERDQLAAERDAALAARARAVAERDAALAARDEAADQRDALSGTTERLQSELGELLTARGAALVMRRAAQQRPSFRPRAGLVAGAIATIVLIAIALVLILALHVV